MEIDINIVVNALKARIAEDAWTIASQAAVIQTLQSEIVTLSGSTDS